MSLAYSGMMSSSRRRRRQEREKSRTIARELQLIERIEKLKDEHPGWTGARSRIEAQRQLGAGT